MEVLDQKFRTHKLWEIEDKAAFLRDHKATRLMASFGTLQVDTDLMDALPALEMISVFGVGVDMVDLDAAKARGIRVTNTPDVLNDAVAEMTLALMLATCRQIVHADAFVRAGKWSDAPYPLTGELTGAKVGILGLGRIGKEIALRCQAFKMQVVYSGRREQPFQPYQYYSDLVEMARDVDWLIGVVPGDTGTQGLVSREVLEALGPQGSFVNVGRGSLVDEGAMLDLLKNGGLGAAGLDVFFNEPEISPEFFELSNVVLIPHQASATHKTRWAMGDLFVRNLLAYCSGTPLISPVI
ncbi:MAG: 2-hydroxyacid dehydrogenase [Marinosulfonomonas sp.]|nr:2-hydroxyacid dehydrogenase [Marinosulfonomonas sp.]